MIKTYISTYFIDIIALLYLFSLLRNSNMEINYKKPFLYSIVLTIIIILSEAGTILTNNGASGLRGVNILCNILGFSLTPVIPLALISISDISLLREHKWLMLPTGINMVAAALSNLLKWIFYVDSGNHYYRGKYFTIFVGVYIINLLLLFISTLRMGKKYCYPIQRKMIMLSLFTAAGTSIQLIDSSVHSSWHCITISIFLYYILFSEFESSFDAMTGLYNRAAFEKKVRQIANCKAFSVIVLDINDFKSINDTYGHDYGDYSIKTVAGIIRESMGSHYSCYRAGGDEFYVIGSETDSEKIQYQLKKITNALKGKRELDGRLPTIAYGYSIFPGGRTPNFQKILNEADSQMYYYKKLNKDNADRP